MSSGELHAAIAYALVWLDGAVRLRAALQPVELVCAQRVLEGARFAEATRPDGGPSCVSGHPPAHACGLSLSLLLAGRGLRLLLLVRLLVPSLRPVPPLPAPGVQCRLGFPR